MASEYLDTWRKQLKYSRLADLDCPKILLAASSMTKKCYLIWKFPLQLLIPYRHNHDQRATIVRKSPLPLPTPQLHSQLQSASPNCVPCTLPLNRFKASENLTTTRPHQTPTHSSVTIAVGRSCGFCLISTSWISPESTCLMIAGSHLET